MMSRPLITELLACGPNRSGNHPKTLRGPVGKERPAGPRSHIRERNALIGQYAARRDAGALKREAHMLIGAAGNIGLNRVMEVAAALEEACSTEFSKAAARLAGELQKSLAQSALALRRWLELQSMAAEG